MSSTSSEDSETDTSDTEENEDGENTNPNQDSGSMQQFEIYNPATDDLNQPDVSKEDVPVDMTLYKTNLQT